MENNPLWSCLIVDDEALARQLIQTHLSAFPARLEIHSCASGAEAALFLQSNKVDLMFLDIEMPRLRGTDLLRSLKNPPKVILTTAYSEFALEGYELNVVDYLLKPISYERFSLALNKALEILNLEKRAHDLPSAHPEEKCILIRSSHQHIRIDMNDILYIEGLHKYVKIVTGQKVYTTLFSVTAMEQELPSGLFFRCHRSFIANLSKVELVDGNQAVLGAHKIPVSKPLKGELLRRLGKQLG